MSKITRFLAEAIGKLFILKLQWCFANSAILSEYIRSIYTYDKSLIL